VLEFAEIADEPLLILGRRFGSRAWFDAACQVARVHPAVLLESGVPQTLIQLAATSYGVAVVPSTVSLPEDGISAVPLVYRGASLGRWLTIAWDPLRFLAPYATQFVDELVASARVSFRAAMSFGVRRRCRSQKEQLVDAVCGSWQRHHRWAGACPAGTLGTVARIRTRANRLALPHRRPLGRWTTGLETAIECVEGQLWVEAVRKRAPRRVRRKCRASRSR
jgi:hypothetical protein